MNKILKNSSIGVAGALLMSLMMTPVAMAWGPEDRPTYTMEKPAERATFNSIIDNAAVGDERDFVRIAEKDPNATYTNDLELEAGKQYEVYIYYHNDASKDFNYTDDQRGIAMNVTLSSVFPHELAEGQSEYISGKITSTNTEPLAVWDEAKVTAKQAMTLHYVEGSAKIYNRDNKDGTVLPISLFSEDGTFIGMSKLNGIIPGCDEYSGHIVYTLQTVAASTSVTPDPEQPDEPTPEKPVVPDTPSELPHTGPLEVILAIVIIGMIVAGILYWNKTRKAVKNTSKRAKGKK